MIILLSGTGQPIHFSQFFDSPLLLNPANTGKYDGDWRIVNNYRNQWSAIVQPYQTTFLGYDRPFYLYNEHLSYGVLLLHDQSGTMNYSSTRFYLSGAYHTLWNNNFFHIGLQFGWVYNTFQYGSLTLPDQYDRDMGDFNSDIPTSETLGEQSHYPDFNLGLIWERNLWITRMSLGYSLSHLNNPKHSFTDGEINNRTGVKHILFAETPLPVLQSLTLTPRYLLIAHGNTSARLSGIQLSHKRLSGSIKSIYGGVYIRNMLITETDAAIFVVGMEINNFKIGINYDINISGLRQVSHNRGAFEISLIFLAPSSIIDRFTIPCYRI